ncbi:MAG: DUF6782 family putative metallopeptidase [Alphaproteobacteria bacterium]
MKRRILKEEFNNSSADRIEGLLARLEKVPEGKAVVDFLRANKVEIKLKKDPANWAASTLTITGIKDGLYQYKDPVIILKKSLSDDNLLQAIVHESQHLKQHLSGVGNPDRVLSEKEYILFYRAAEADAQALCTHVTWKLKEAGDAGPWEAAKFVGYADICDAYEKVVTDGPDDTKALRTAFDAWFDKPERLAGYNKSTVDSMIPFLKKGREEVFKDHGLTEKPLDATWLDKLDKAAHSPYLLAHAERDLLTEEHFIRDTHTRPPEKKKAPANENRRPDIPGAA